MREGGKEKDKVQKTDKGFMYNAYNMPEREAFGLDRKLGGKAGGKEEWEWHLKDKDVLKSLRVWGKLAEDVTGIWE